MIKNVDSGHVLCYTKILRREFAQVPASRRHDNRCAEAHAIKFGEELVMTKTYRIIGMLLAIVLLTGIVTAAPLTVGAAGDPYHAKGD